MSTLIIGLGNKARQGKNVVATELEAAIKAAGHDVKMYALADELKTYCRDHHEELFAKYPDVPKDCKEDPIYGYVGMLQHYGTNVVRASNPNHWVEVLDARIKAEKPAIAIVTDVRFPNEATWVHENDGILVKVVRMKQDGTVYLDPKRDPNHPSEIALDGFSEWDFIILGADGDVESLKLVSQQMWGMISDPENVSPVALIPDVDKSGPSEVPETWKDDATGVS